MGKPSRCQNEENECSSGIPSNVSIAGDKITLYRVESIK